MSSKAQNSRRSNQESENAAQIGLRSASVPATQRKKLLLQIGAWLPALIQTTHAEEDAVLGAPPKAVGRTARGAMRQRARRDDSSPHEISTSHHSAERPRPIHDRKAADAALPHDLPGRTRSFLIIDREWSYVHEVRNASPRRGRVEVAWAHDSNQPVTIDDQKVMHSSDGGQLLGRCGVRLGTDQHRPGRHNVHDVLGFLEHEGPEVAMPVPWKNTHVLWRDLHGFQRFG